MFSSILDTVSLSGHQQAPGPEREEVGGRRGREGGNKRPVLFLGLPILKQA